MPTLYRLCGTLTAAALLAVAALSPGRASDLGSPPPLKPTIAKWHGPYAGFMAGGQSVSVDRETATTSVRQRHMQAIAGLVAGINWRPQKGRNDVIYGVEADLMSLSQLKGDSPGEPDWLATVRARYGMTSGPALAYVTGGLSLTSHRVGIESIDRLSPGVVVGAGIETLAVAKMRTRLEYLYTHPLSLSGGRDDAHMIRAAVLFRID